jgi:hypothetical protein
VASVPRAKGAVNVMPVGCVSAHPAEEADEIRFRRGAEEPAAEGFEAQGAPRMHQDVRVAGLPAEPVELVAPARPARLAPTDQGQLTTDQYASELFVWLAPLAFAMIYWQKMLGALK